MCAHYTLHVDADVLNSRFRSKFSPHTEVSFPKSAYPGTKMPILVNSDWGHMFHTAVWGVYPPSLTVDPKRDLSFVRKWSTYNARSETVHERKTFKNLWAKKQRCIIPVTSFMEWIEVDGKKKRLFIEGDRSILGIAGLYSGSLGSPAMCYTMLTTEPNRFMAKYHDRQPLILAAEQEEHWLSGADFDLAVSKVPLKLVDELPNS